MKQLKIFLLPISAIIIFCIALKYALTEDRISRFFENFFKSFWCLIHVNFWRLLGHKSAGYYRLFNENGGCGPFVFLKKRQVASSGKRYVLGTGFSQ